MAFVDPNCRAIATKAAGGKLTESEILDAFAAIDERARLYRESGGTDTAGHVRKWVADQTERAKIAAAMQKRHAALNVIIRDKVDTQVKGMIAAGLAPHQALRAVLEGINSPAPGSRQSAAAAVQAYEARYLGGFFSQLERDKPHLVMMLDDAKLDADVLTEMWELRDGGSPGSTKNADAQYLAKAFADFAEMSRTELNRLGASIGKLDGWAGVQIHDDIKLLKAGKDQWIGRIAPLLDADRTFGEGTTSTEAIDILGGIYDTIITGISSTPTSVEKGQRVNPANLAKSLGKSRVLHFKDANAALAYRAEFGYSNTIAGMFSHLQHVSKIGGLMQTLGPNPEVMFTSIAAKLQREIKESPDLAPAEKKRLGDKLNTEAGALRQALDVATGLVSRPVNVNAAKIGNDIRAGQGMAKLGAAVVTAIPSDTFTTAIASQFRGSGFFKGLVRQIGGIMRGRPRGEQGEIAYLIGEGFDGLVGHINAAAAAQDGPRGLMGRMTAQFFKWNGLTGWTDTSRSVAGRIIAAELGTHAGTPLDKLPPAFRNVIVQAGFSAAEWDAMGKVVLRQSNGKPYLTPDRIRELPDDVIAGLVPERIANAKGDLDKIATILADERRNLEIKMLGYVADQTSYAVIESDARTRRYTTQGMRPGTLGGEAIRFIMQFKGFPLAFTQRVYGRALFGHAKDASMLDRLGHVGSLIGGLAIAGYMSIVMKDLLKGYWPPRNPADPRTILAALQQGGAMGIYGDYLFSQVNRFGGGLLETALGPTFGTAGDLWTIYNDARDYALSHGEDKFSKAQAFSTLLSNVPYANLHVLRPALDYLVITSIREALSPGYMRKQQKNRATEYGQKPILDVKPLDPLNIAPTF